MTPFLRPLAFTFAFAPALHAVTATALSSFEGIEEPLVRYFPATRQFVPDTFVNITDEGNGTFRMTDRVGPDWWDGDRDTQNRDRQRAEVKGLGPHQRDGEVFEYSTTWRTNPDFHGAPGFCHVFQLKALNGDNGAPLVTLSIHGAHATVEANPAGRHFVAREFPWRPGVWQTVHIRIKTSPHADGSLEASVEGDAFQGRQHVELSRPGADVYRPKWGLYRKAVVKAGMGTDFVEHRNVTAVKVGAPASDNAAVEQAARAAAKQTSFPAELARLQAEPATPARDITLASLATAWAETAPTDALRWVQTLPPGKLRADALERVVSRWADRDAPAAIAWIKQQSPAPELDPVLWLLATDTTYRYVQRPLALDATAAINDPNLRAKAYAHVIGIWARDRRADAIAFVEQHANLNAEQKASLVAALRAGKSTE